MKRYEAYKPSNLPWVVRIPSGWKISKNSQLFRESSELSERGEEPLLSLSQYTGISYKSNAVKVGMREADSKVGYRVIHKDDIVMNIMLAWNGSTAVSPFDGIISPAYAVYRQRTALNPKYFHYLFRIPAICSYFESNSTGLIKSRLRLYSDSFMRLFSIVPPREEQDQIVCYLDWQVSKINRLIAAKRKQIALLKDNLKSAVAYYTTHGLGNHELCQSEIYWLTHYPNDWRVTKLRYILEKRRREVTPNAELLICSNSGEVVKRGDGKLGLVASSDDIYQGVTAGDLLIHGMDTWHGAIAISSFDGMCTPVVHVCTCKEEKRYVAYYLKMMAYTKVFKAISNGVRQNTSDFRSWDKVGDLLICLPEHDEQVAIADKLDHLTAQTKAGISIFEKQIEHLQELRTRLTSDAVTGQVDVRGIEVPEFEYVGEVSETNDNDEEELEDSEEED